MTIVQSSSSSPFISSSNEEANNGSSVSTITLAGSSSEEEKDEEEIKKGTCISPIRPICNPITFKAYKSILLTSPDSNPAKVVPYFIFELLLSYSGLTKFSFIAFCV